MKAILVLLFVIAMALNSYAQSPKQKQPLPKPNEAQQNTKPDERGTDEMPLIIKVLPPPDEAEKTAANKQERQDKSNSDWWLVALTGVLAFIGVVQIIVFSIQARRLRQTVDEMRKSADAQYQAQRAFVAFITVEPVAFADLKTLDVTQYAFAPQWKNTGNTPTRDLTTHVSCRIFENELSNDWDFPDIWSKASQGFRVRGRFGISPQNTIIGEAIGLSVQDINDVIARKTWLYMWGWTAYSDIFPDTKRHITRFAVQIQIIGNSRDPKGLTFKYPFAKKYNCSDEECDAQGYPESWVARTLEV